MAFVLVLVNFFVYSGKKDGLDRLITDTRGDGPVKQMINYKPANRYS